MKTFKDNADRVWTVAINVAAVKRVRGTLDIDLYGLVAGGGSKLGELLADPITLVDVLYVLCKAEADAASVTDEDFGRAMAGDTIQHASDAFVAELIDFFPDPRVRAALLKVTEAGRKVRDLMMTEMEARAAALDVASLARTLTASSGDSPEFLASTPDPSLSAN